MVFPKRLTHCLLALLTITQGNGYPTDPEEEPTGISVNDLGFLFDGPSQRPLTQEETRLADEARTHIARVMERNLLEMLAINGTKNLRKYRQEEELDEEDEIPVTLNPNTLPQVAAILGAIFSGHLNLTNVVDKAFYLVPDTVRNQVHGLVKLLTGQTLEPAATTTPMPFVAPPKARTNLTTPPTTVIKLTMKPTTTSPPQVPDVAAFLTPLYNNGTKYRVIRKNPTTSPPDVITPPPPPSPPPALGVSSTVKDTDDFVYEDDELDKEREQQQALLRSGPLMDDEISGLDVSGPIPEKEARFFLEPLRKLFASPDFNLTTAIRVMPELFKGAREAFVLLETLGQFVGITDLDDLEEEE